MKHGSAVAILILLMMVVGCAERRQVKATFLSDPPGGTLYSQDGELLGSCPKTLWYDADEEAIERGYLDAEGLTVRWATGPEKKSNKLIRITVNKTARRVMFVQPEGAIKTSADSASGQERKMPGSKQVEPQEMKEVQIVDTEPSKKILAPISKEPVAKVEPAVAEPIVSDKPVERPVGRILTLAEQQLVLLDWHRSNRGGAHVQGKRPVGGPGVEFGAYFPSNSPGSCSLSLVSSGAGGRGSLVGTDVRGYDTFALKFTLVSINGQNDPASKQRLVVGAVIGPTAEGRLTGYEPVTLSLADSEKIVTAQTPVSTDEIYEIGFHIHALDYDDWAPSGSRIVFQVEPVEAGEASPFNYK